MKIRLYPPHTQELRYGSEIATDAGLEVLLDDVDALEAEGWTRTKRIFVPPVNEEIADLTTAHLIDEEHQS